MKNYWTVSYSESWKKEYWAWAFPASPTQTEKTGRQ
jgi:hypothetical protein